MDKLATVLLIYGPLCSRSMVKWNDFASGVCIYSTYNSFLATLPCLHVVIDLQEQRHCLCRELGCACRHQQRLHLQKKIVIACVRVQHTREAHLPDVNASIALAKSVAVAKLGDDCDGVEPGILGERRRDDLERVSVCLEAVCLHACQNLCVLR